MDQMESGCREVKRRVLIVEDEDQFRTLLVQILEAEGFEARSAQNGLEAKSILTSGKGKFDLVISDIRMPEMDGVSLLQLVRSSCDGTRFILMTGFSEVLESKQAFDLGADDFLPKPFRMQHLLSSIEKVFQKQDGQAPDPMVEEDEFSFCKIHVDEFTTASILPSDIYVKLADQKFVKVAREGTEIQVQRIKTYKEKKVEYFYVHNADFQKYAGFTLRIAKALATSKKVTREQKIKLYKHTGEILMNQIFIQDIQPEVLTTSQNIINNTLNLIGDEPEIFDLILLLRSHSDDLYAQSVAVSVYSCLIAKKMGWSSQQTLMKLSLGGLFHDIGKKEIPSAVLRKSRREMTSDEIALYESHPQRGKDILSSFSGFPSDVIQISFQHHENNQGTGYPLGLNQIRIHPLAKVIHLADEFFHCCQKYRNQDPQPWSLALKELWEMKGGEFDPLQMRALMEIFQYPVPAPLLRLKLAG